MSHIWHFLSVKLQLSWTFWRPYISSGSDFVDAPRKGCQGLPEAAAADIVSFAWAVACVEGLRIVAGIWRIQMHYSCVLWRIFCLVEECLWVPLEVYCVRRFCVSISIPFILLQFVHEARQYSMLDRDEEISPGNHSMDHVLQAFGNWAASGISQITRSCYNMVVSGYPG